MRHSWFAPTLLVLLAAGACGGPETGHSFRLITEDGIPTAVTSGGPRFTEPIFRYEKVLTLQQDPDRPESMLYRPGTICMDEEGFFYVVDSGDCRVAVFDPNGVYVRSFGAEGDGPGEFRRMTLQHFNEGVLSFHDGQNLRTTRYRSDGTLLEVITDPKRRSRFQSLHRAPDGGLLFDMSRYEDEAEADLDDAYSWSGRKVVVTNANDDTIAVVVTPWVKTMYSFAGNMGSSRMAYSGSAEALYVPGRGILLSTGVDPVINWFDLAGTPILRIRLELESEPVSSADRDSLRGRVEEQIESGRGPSGPGVARSWLADMKFHEYRAFWDQVVVDDAGYLWLRVPEESWDRPGGAGRLYRVISPEGEYLGDSRWLRSGGTVMRGMFLTVVPAENGEPVPTVFRIVPIPEGLRYPETSPGEASRH